MFQQAQFSISFIEQLQINCHNMISCSCLIKEKGCSARDLVKVKSCRGENLLLNDIKYDLIE